MIPPPWFFICQYSLFVKRLQFSLDLFLVGLELLHLAVELFDEGIALLGFAAEGEEAEVVLVGLDFVVEDVKLTGQA